MRIATWNVNSIRTRIDRVHAFLDRHEIDVLAVQETKAKVDQIPTMELELRGYEMAAVGHSLTASCLHTASDVVVILKAGRSARVARHE